MSFGKSAKMHTQRARVAIKVHQFPINIMNCQTVHKLQGRALNNLVITAWCMGNGWPHVALSRVRTINGIFLQKLLREIKKAWAGI